LTKSIQIALLVLLLFQVGCSKQDRAFKKLSGIWHLTEYRYRTLEGFNYYLDASGEIFFENCDGGLCAYSMNITYSHPKLTGTRDEAGAFTVNDDAGVVSIIPYDISNNPEPTKKHTVMLLTKTEVKFEYVDDLGYAHYYLFER
jgi:hypothetical protein